jgi:carotenoid 1,2-hydratase
MSTRFDDALPPGGYAWWYVDALSDDGRHGLTIIAFVGSVFSPYYAHARRRRGGAADPTNHCAFNVALYAAPGTGAPRGWAMTERGAGALEQGPRHLGIGPSALQWEGDALTLRFDEITVPWPSRIRGTVRLHPQALFDRAYALDAGGHHQWIPLAPCARVEVQMEHPALRWQGTGYLDSNRGARPLERDFTRWDWSRASLAGGRSAVLYDVERQDGSTLALGLQFGAGKAASVFSPPPRVALPHTAWRLPRGTRADPPGGARLLQTLEDGPFYARSVLRTRLLGEDATAIHESLCMRRWAAPAVQLMLPFRMPRRAG